MVGGDIDVDVDVSLGGGGGGIAPGECIVPAVADSASTMLRLTTAQVRRKLFTRRFLLERIQAALHLLQKCKASFIDPRPSTTFLARGRVNA